MKMIKLTCGDTELYINTDFIVSITEARRETVLRVVGKEHPYSVDESAEEILELIGVEDGEVSSSE